MQRDEYRVYEPLKSLIPAPAPLKPAPATDPLDEYVLTDAERLILNNRRTDAKETFLIHMSKFLKQRLRHAAESECITLNDVINKALREWADDFVKSESRRRGD